MNEAIEALLQAIGNQILDMVGDDASKVLAYAEAEDGVISVALFCAKLAQDIPVYSFGGKKLSDLFYKFWEEWGKLNSAQCWRGAAYLIKNGKPHLDLVYSDRFDELLSENTRRSNMVEKYFGSTKVDYSKVKL
ncbi:MAG: hypothetical protein HY911_01915 [Desulfobacterales bacterium]|nr:hypothetical protein [Desulfobacterales bacterium]